MLIMNADHNVFGVVGGFFAHIGVFIHRTLQMAHCAVFRVSRITSTLS